MRNQETGIETDTFDTTVFRAAAELESYADTMVRETESSTYQVCQSCGEPLPPWEQDSVDCAVCNAMGAL